MGFSLQCGREIACGNMLQIKIETSETAGEISKIKRETLKICEKFPEICRYRHTERNKDIEIEEEANEIEKKRRGFRISYAVHVLYILFIF
jgi:hypothetical protein